MVQTKRAALALMVGLLVAVPCRGNGNGMAVGACCGPSVCSTGDCCVKQIGTHFRKLLGWCTYRAHVPAECGCCRTRVYECTPPVYTFLLYQRPVIGGPTTCGSGGCRTGACGGGACAKGVRDRGGCAPGACDQGISAKGACADGACASRPCATGESDCGTARRSSWKDWFSGCNLGALFGHKR
jgi:hypothetical protein